MRARADRAGRSGPHGKFVPKGLVSIIAPINSSRIDLLTWARAGVMQLRRRHGMVVLDLHGLTPEI